MTGQAQFSLAAGGAPCYKVRMRMKPIALITAAFALLGLDAAMAASTDPAKPNIIFFLVDDMGWQDTSVPFWRDEDGSPKPTFLNKRYRTPNMEKLAEKGVTFTNAYASAICSPTRCSLMSGMNAARHRVTNWTLELDKSTDAAHPQISPPEWAVNGIQPDKVKPRGTTKLPLTEERAKYAMTKPYTTCTPLPALLKQQGYTTIHCGKAHWGTRGTPGANPKNFGFDYNIAGTEIGGPGSYLGSQKYGKGPFHVCGLDENNYYQDDVFLTEAITREALSRLTKLNDDPKEKGKPFYLYMSQYAIHAPFNPDKRFVDNYTNPNDGKPWNNTERNYCGLIEGMDKSLGDLMQWLEENKLADNTVILFMGDNGGLALRSSGRLGDTVANYPLKCGKGSTYEGGIREPMIAYWPGVTQAGTVNRTPILAEDFFSSILDIAGTRKPKTTQVVDGVSFVPALRGQAMPMDRPLLFHLPNVWGEGNGRGQGYGPQSALIVGDWKLIYRHAPQTFELYNLKEDISEEHDLSASEPQKLKEMISEMSHQMKLTKAQMPTYKAGNTLGAKAGSEVPLPDQVKLRK